MSHLHNKNFRLIFNLIPAAARWHRSATGATMLSLQLTSYYIFTKILLFPASLQWANFVCDVIVHFDIQKSCK